MTNLPRFGAITWMQSLEKLVGSGWARTYHSIYISQRRPKVAPHSTSAIRSSLHKQKLPLWAQGLFCSWKGVLPSIPIGIFPRTASQWANIPPVPTVPKSNLPGFTMCFNISTKHFIMLFYKLAEHTNIIIQLIISVQVLLSPRTWGDLFQPPPPVVTGKNLITTHNYAINIV